MTMSKSSINRHRHGAAFKPTPSQCTEPAPAGFEVVTQLYPARSNIDAGKLGPISFARISEGCIAVLAKSRATDRQTAAPISLLLYPGDLIWLHQGVPGRQQSYVSCLPATIERFVHAESRLDESLKLGEVIRFLSAKCSAITDRSAQRAYAIGHTMGEVRVAMLLLEWAERLGTETIGGAVLPTPLGRRDMASYLGLNPDTLSRILSRFREQQLLVMPTRERMILPDVAALSRINSAN